MTSKKSKRSRSRSGSRQRHKKQKKDDVQGTSYRRRARDASNLPCTAQWDPAEDLRRRQLARSQLQVPGVASESPEDELVRRAKEGMGGDEAQFSVEMPVTGKTYMWADTYQPRKPRYFNLVQTGFMWETCKTHYDFENPPPKLVQGYKFNIFYPDLIDQRSTPHYSFELMSPNNQDFVILRFHAGPPYEDIAFKIVNNDWNYSHRRGFRCQFANGILQLWFNFKRHRYRR